MRLPPIDDDDDLRHILEQHASDGRSSACSGPLPPRV
jgi:hypothetical protein